MITQKDIEKLPAEIKAAREKYQEIIEALPANEKLIAQLELEALTQATGTNETQRRAAKEQALAANEPYQTAIKQRIQIKEDAAKAEIEIDYQRNRLKVAEIIAKMSEE